MSNEIENNSQPSDQAIALFLQENDGDGLTNVLVEALYEALRIMGDEDGVNTVH